MTHVKQIGQGLSNVSWCFDMILTIWPEVVLVNALQIQEKFPFKGDIQDVPKILCHVREAPAHEPYLLLLCS